MTEPGPGGERRSFWLRLRPAYAWLGKSISFRVIIAGLAIFAMAGAIFVCLGGVDVAADTPDGWLARNLLHFVFKRSEASRSADIAPPSDFSSPSRVRLAAQHFDMVCANCHGRPGSGQSVIALSMSPRPQYLPKVVGQFTDPELYMIIEHGVKYSAMPSWPTDTRGDEVWSMVAFLRQLPKLDAGSYHAMTALPPKDSAAPQASASDASLRSADAYRNMPPFDEFEYAAPSSGFADQSIGDDPVRTCARCHGPDGTGAATGGEAPNLTLQDPAYLQAALEAYTRGARKSGFMQTIAAELSEAQIVALAHYYSGLPIATPASPPAAADLVKRGEAIVTEGIAQSAIPPCADCHESQGGKITRAPHLAGQSETYLRHELLAMRHGGRGSTGGWNPMPTVAHALGDKDIAAVAAYYSGLKPARSAAAAEPPPAPSSPPVSSAAMAAAKATFATNCVKCHTNAGRGDLQGNYPNLTLQTAPFVLQNLYAFHSGVRPSDKMSEVTDGLTFEDMKGLASYVNSLTPQEGLARPDPASASRGAAIATRGDPARGVPACLSCHGANGVAALPLISRLQGQNAVYLRRRLDGFAKPYDQHLSTLNPMPWIARKLTDQERADLASYFAALPPLQKPALAP